METFRKKRRPKFEDFNLLKNDKEDFNPSYSKLFQ